MKGQMSEADGARFLAEPVTDYEIIVLAPDMTPFQGLTEDQLKSDAYLEGLVELPEEYQLGRPEFVAKVTASPENSTRNEG